MIFSLSHTDQALVLSGLEAGRTGGAHAVERFSVGLQHAVRAEIQQQAALCPDGAVGHETAVRRRLGRQGGELLRGIAVERVVQQQRRLAAAQNEHRLSRDRLGERVAGVLQHAHAPFAAGKAYGERTDVAPYGAVLCVAAQQDAAERVAERRREQQQTQRNGKVIPCAEQQPPFRDRAERCLKILLVTQKIE